MVFYYQKRFFISLHSSRSVSDPRSYVFLTNSHSYMFGLVKDNDLLTHDSPERSIFEFIISPNPRKSFIGYCRGLLCFSDGLWDGYGFGIYLINPFVRKYKEIDIESSCYADLIREMKYDKMNPPKGYVIRAEIGYSEIEDDYKVLRMILPNDIERTNTKVEIYSLKSGKWKSVDVTTEIEIDLLDPVVCVLGSLYWHIKNGTRYLLCFDLKDQVFSKIELPKPYLELPVSLLFNKNDSLVIVLHEMEEDSVSGELKMCLLMLEEKNLEGHKWKECSYRISSDYIDWVHISFFIPLGFTIGGRLICCVHNDNNRDSEKSFLVEVDLDNKCVIEKFKFNFREHLVRRGGGYIAGATNVLESLVLFSG